MSVEVETEERRPEIIRSARSAAAWVKRPDVQPLILTGADRLDLLQRLTTNDLTDVKPGKGKADSPIDREGTHH